MTSSLLTVFWSSGPVADTSLSLLSVWVMLSLLHFVWQGALWAMLSAVSSRMLSSCLPGARYGVQVCVLSGMVISFVVTLWTGCPWLKQQSRDPGMVDWAAQDATSKADRSTITGEGGNQTDRSVPRSVAEEARSTGALEVNRQWHPTSKYGESFHVVPQASRSEWNSSSGEFARLLVRIAPSASLLYFTGVVLMMLRLGLGLGRSCWLSKKSVLVTDVSLLRLLNVEASRMGLRAVPVLMWCQRVSVPFVVGVVKPAIFLPISFSHGLSADQISAILAHELAHIRRGDLLVNLFQRVVEAVLFFHPAVWYVNHRIRVEREMCCDDCVVSAGWPRLIYADALVRMAELCVWHPGRGLCGEVASAAGTHSSEFKRRVLRLLSVPMDASITISKSVLCISGLLSVLVISTFLSANPPDLGAPQMAGTVDTNVSRVPGSTPVSSQVNTLGQDLPQNEVPVALSPAETIAATVVLTDGTPVSGLRVTAYYDDGRQVKEFETGKTGDLVVPGSWLWESLDDEKAVTLIAQQGDLFGTFSFRNFRECLQRKSAWHPNSAAMLTEHPVRLVLKRLDRLIRGRVTDKSQRGVANIRIRVSDWLASDGVRVASLGAFKGPGLPLPETHSNAEGRFELKVPSGVHVGAYNLDADYCQIMMRWNEQISDIGDQVLERGGQIQGVVRHLVTGRPVPGATLWIRGLSLDGRYGSFAHAETNAQGEFTTSALLPDQYKITVTPPAAQATLVPTSPARAVVTSHRQASTEILVKEGILLKGRCIESRTGLGVPGQRIHLTAKLGLNPQSETDFGCFARTDNHGDFQFFCPIGACTVQADTDQRETHPDSSRTIQIRDGMLPSLLVLRLGPGIPARNAAKIVPQVAKVEATRARDSSPAPHRPIQKVLLLPSPNVPVGEYVVRTVFQRSNYVNEWSLKSGLQFDKEFMPGEVGKTARLLIDVPGYAPVWTSEFKVQAILSPIEVPLVAEEFVVLNGRVLDQNQKPLSGVRVRARRIFYGQDSRFPYGPEVTTDAEGKYVLQHLRRGEEVVLTADHPDHEDLGQVTSPLLSITESKPIVVKDMILSPPDQIVSGIVRDQDGIPIPQVSVLFESHPTRETKTDEQGRFQLNGLPRGQLPLQLQASDGSHTQRTLASGTRDARLFLALQSLYNRPENQLELSLTAPDNPSLLNWTYYLINEDNHTVLMWGSRQTIAPAGEKVDLGSFLRKNAFPQLSIAVVATGYRYTTPQRLILRPKLKPVHYTLEPAQAPRLKILVVDTDGQPVAGAKLGESLQLTPDVSLRKFRYIGNSSEPTVTTGPDGIYEYRNLPHGISLSIYTNAPGFAGAWSDQITLDKDTDLVLKLKPAKRAISGRILNPQGAPVADAAILVHDFSQPRTKSLNDGAFRVEGVPDGELLLFVRSFGYQDKTVLLKDDEATKPVTIELYREDGVLLPADAK